jgi:hypothetical protein
VPVSRWKYLHRRRSLSQLLAVLIACNYFAFRVELFPDENEDNHPGLFTGVASFTQPALNWETFDKDNAPKAFTILVDPQIIFITIFESPLQTDRYTFEPYQPVRDKSPPPVFSPIILS